MELPEYVTIDEVKRVCKELGIRDWTAITEPEVSPEEAETILSEVNVKGMDIALEALRTWRGRQRSNLERLLEYARLCRVEHIMRTYLEAMG